MNKRTAIVAWALTALFALASVTPALAQGFQVKPMRMEVAPRAGQAVEIPLEVVNTAGDLREIDVRVVELTQARSGSWKLIEPDSGESLAGRASAREWISLSESRVQIAPLEPAKVTVRVSPPKSARGFYFAGLVVETPLPSEISGIVVRTRFLIPIIVEIQGRPVRQHVTLDDVGMNYLSAEGSPATTTAFLETTNRGQSFSRVRGEIVVERKIDDRLRPVTRVEINERSIIPGVTLDLGSDLARRLPSGSYHLHAQLFVDGRRLAPVEKDLEFSGDPSADAMAYDTALVLDPPLVEMEVTPGATRTTVLRIENPGTDPVAVRLASTTPRAMAGMVMGDIRGEDMSAEPWTEVRPASFTIRPGRWQNVRVVSRVPRQGVGHPNYYADLTVNGSYADGQSAGETHSTVHLANTAMESKRGGVIEQVSLAEGESPSQYFVQMRFTNVGDVHIEPTARARLLTAQLQEVRNEAFSGEEGSLLPFGKRSFSVGLDFANLDPGYYALRADVNIGSGEMISRQELLSVQTEEAQDADGKTVSIPRVTVVDARSGDLPEGARAFSEPQMPLAPEGQPAGSTPAGEESDDP